MDRNFVGLSCFNPVSQSLSARRAWIEICCLGRSARVLAVALRKESVDRNTNPGSTTLTFPGSLSARRAWIEICCLGRSARVLARRSPQGERG